MYEQFNSLGNVWRTDFIFVVSFVHNYHTLITSNILVNCKKPPHLGHRLQKTTRSLIICKKHRIFSKLFAVCTDRPICFVWVRFWQMGPGFPLRGITDGKRRRLVETTWSARVGPADRAAPTPLLTHSLLCSPSRSQPCSASSRLCSPPAAMVSWSDGESSEDSDVQFISSYASPIKHYKKYVNLWPSVSDPGRIGHRSMTISDQLVKSCSGGSKT